jgi:hypothetical protein
VYDGSVVELVEGVMMVVVGGGGCDGRDGTAVITLIAVRSLWQ